LAGGVVFADIITGLAQSSTTVIPYMADGVITGRDYSCAAEDKIAVSCLILAFTCFSVYKTLSVR
jgi:hypothetical protein